MNSINLTLKNGEKAIVSDAMNYLKSVNANMMLGKE
jgi:hypothetical protein